MRTNWKARVAGFLLALSIALTGTRSYAQSATSDSTPSALAASPQAQSSAASLGVEEIVVTAQKREQLSQDVPIAMTTLTSSTLKFRQIDDLLDLQMQVPGMQYGLDTGADQQIYIRGIGIDDSSGGVESPIATYIDGVYQTRTFRSPTLGIDLERVEVLKGPQGTLFGRNATGGALQFILKPPTDELTGSVKGGVGSYGQWLTQADGSGPLIKHLLDLRVAGAVSRDGGWIVNLNSGRTVNDHMEGDGRVALAFHPLDNLAIDYDLLLSKQVGGGVTGGTTNIVVGPPSLQLASGLPMPIPRNDYVNTSNPWKAKLNWPLKGDAENTQNAGTIKWDVTPWASLKSITAFQQHTLGGISWPGSGIAAPILNFGGRTADDSTFTQELNLGGTRELNFWKTTQPFTWIVGAYYMNEHYSTGFGPTYVNFNSLLANTQGRERLDDYSVFGDTTIPLPWNLSLFGGVRYTYDKKALNQTFSLQAGPVHNDPFNLGPYTPPLAIPGVTCYGLRTIDESHNVSPRVGMGWEPNETMNFYVKYSEGYNAGGNWPFACNDSYKPETLDAVEGGMKGRFFEGRLVTDFAGFYNDFKDYQVFTEFPSTTGISSGIINAPKAEMWGGEFQITAIPFERFTANVGISVMHSQYDTLFDTDPANPKAGVQNLAGNQMQRAPNSTEQVGLQYDWQVPWGTVLGGRASRFLDLGALRVRGEWYHTDYIIFRPFNGTGFGGANDRQNPYSIFNFYASLPTQDGKWSLGFFAKNFLAQQYFQYKIASAYARYGVGGAPQWFGGDLTYHFE
jgi:iron complex outermembrane recepter protein